MGCSIFKEKTLERVDFISKIFEAFESSNIVALIGPRQCGKTTLATIYAKTYADLYADIHHFDLEKREDLNKLNEPYLILKNLQGLIIIDEIQLAPDLFPTLRVLVDENPEQRFLILGSASPELINRSAESLAGRIRYVELTPFSLHETQNVEQLWTRGGFPRSYLAKNDDASLSWRESFTTTFLERDLGQLGFNFPPKTMQRFWSMLAHYHGQLFNASELGNSLGLAHTTIRRYLDALTGTFMIRTLHPWHTNLKKRQIKTPKIFFRDSGILHAMLNIKNYSELIKHPKLGASWEGMAMEQIISYHAAREQECYFWATHAQAELDLYIAKYGKSYAFEFKFTDSPAITKSMRVAIEDLQLEKLTIIYPGTGNYSLDESVQAIGLETYIQNTNA